MAVVYILYFSCPPSPRCHCGEVMGSGPECVVVHSPGVVVSGKARRYWQSRTLRCTGSHHLDVMTMGVLTPEHVVHENGVTASGKRVRSCTYPAAQVSHFPVVVMERANDPVLSASRACRKCAVVKWAGHRTWRTA
jgi:hypothetical protein